MASEKDPSFVVVSFMEQLRVFKCVCQKLRSSLVAGRENEIVSPSTLCKNFVSASESAMATSSGSTDSGIFPGEGDSPRLCGGASGCPFVSPAEGWTVEYCERTCERCGANGLCLCNKRPPNLALRPLAEAAYREHYYRREHWNYFTEEADIGPVMLSLKAEDNGENYRILLRSSDHYLHGVATSAELCGVCREAYMREEVISALNRLLALERPFKTAHYPEIEQELLRIDETFVKAHHKIGVIRVKEGQRSEEEIFANCEESGPFDEFLKVLGTRITLRGFKGFLGGLDSDRNLTGEHSVFTDHQGLEVMFHVATLLPYSAHDSQQVNKKRHIGNDIVCIVFLDSSRTSFNPLWVRSHFIHCYLVVQHVVGAHGQPLYKMAVARRSTVPGFFPELRNVGLFAHSKFLQQFILTKAINAERASYHAPRFLKLTNRSRAQLLHEFSASLTEFGMARTQGRASRKICKRSNWLPIGASRPPSPLMDSVREKFTNNHKLAEDFSLALRGCDLADVIFIVGEDRVMLYGVKAILACRSRVFRTMFKEGLAPSSASSMAAARLASPVVWRRNQSSPQGSRKGPTQPSTGRAKLLLTRKKKSAPDFTRSGSPSPCSSEGVAGGVSGGVAVPYTFSEDPRNVQIREQYVIESFSEMVFSELLNFLMTGACSIKPSNVIGLACSAERYEVEELKQACVDKLPACLTVSSCCTILSQLEKYLAFASSKTMIVQCLEFVDNNAREIYMSQELLSLSENMMHLVLRRDADVEELLKVKAAFAWGEVNAGTLGSDHFKNVVTPLVKHVRLHLIDPQEIMKVVVPSGIFDMDKVMTALAYQVDPHSVEMDHYTMFRPRKKSSVLSSR